MGCPPRIPAEAWTLFEIELSAAPGDERPFIYFDGVVRVIINGSKPIIILIMYVLLGSGAETTLLVTLVS